MQRGRGQVGQPDLQLHEWTLLEVHQSGFFTDTAQEFPIYTLWMKSELDNFLLQTAKDLHLGIVTDAKTLFKTLEQGKDLGHWMITWCHQYKLNLDNITMYNTVRWRTIDGSLIVAPDRNTSGFDFYDLSTRLPLSFPLSSDIMRNLLLWNHLGLKWWHHIWSSCFSYQWCFSNESSLSSDQIPR